MSSHPTESTRRAVPRTESRSRTWIRPATLLLAAPFLLFTGYAFHPDLPMDTAAALRDLADERTVYLVAKLAVAFGSLLFVPLILLVRHRATPQRGRVLATVAAVCCSVGFASNALSQALWGYLLWFAGAPGVDPAAGVALVEARPDFRR